MEEIIVDAQDLQSNTDKIYRIYNSVSKIEKYFLLLINFEKRDFLIVSFSKTTYKMLFKMLS